MSNISMINRLEMDNFDDPSGSISFDYAHCSYTTVERERERGKRDKVEESSWALIKIDFYVINF